MKRGFCLFLVFVLVVTSLSIAVSSKQSIEYPTRIYNNNSDDVSYEDNGLEWAFIFGGYAIVEWKQESSQNDSINDVYRLHSQGFLFYFGKNAAQDLSLTSKYSWGLCTTIQFCTDKTDDSNFVGYFSGGEQGLICGFWNDWCDIVFP